MGSLKRNHLTVANVKATSQVAPSKYISGDDLRAIIISTALQTYPNFFLCSQTRGGATLLVGGGPPPESDYKFGKMKFADFPGFPGPLNSFVHAIIK